MPNFELYLDNDQGTRIALLEDVIAFEWVRVANDIGRALLDMPASFDLDSLAVDRLLELWRQPAGGTMGLEFMGFLRYWQPFQTPEGLDVCRLVFVDLNDLLRRRIVAYAAGTSQAQRTNQADDMAKDVVRDNLAGNASAARDLTGKTGITFSVQADATAGPSITKAFSWQNVLAVLQDIADASRTAGTELYFDVVPVTATQWEFRTFTGQRGADRTWPDGTNPLLFGEDFGNLAEPVLTLDRLSEINYAYAGGQGEGPSRVIEERSDTDRINASQWNRREGFADARNSGTTAGVQAAGDELLAGGRPKQHFQGKLLDTEGVRYGRDWNFGDRVTISAFGEQFDAMVRRIYGRVDEDGFEELSALVEADL